MGMSPRIVCGSGVRDYPYKTPIKRDRLLGTHTLSPPHRWESRLRSPVMPAGNVSRGGLGSLAGLREFSIVPWEPARGIIVRNHCH
jgi:hypothetical protein